jgi:16S rRNA (uracil1498-N3)-methyltransferase
VTIPVFLVDAEQLRATDRIVLDGDEGRHAALVRRLRIGEPVDLTDGHGHLARCVVVEAAHSELTCDVRERADVPRPSPKLVVAQALPKGDRGELAVGMLTEVGVDEIVPWAAGRNVVRWEGERGANALRRWRSAAREAAKQSRRVWLPVVAELATTRQLAERLATSAAALVLHEEATTPLGEADVPATGEIVLVVGPEGGITADELDLFSTAGGQQVSIGPTVLRTSTAGIVAAAVLLARTTRWATRR